MVKVKTKAKTRKVYKPVPKSRRPDAGPAKEVVCKRCGDTHQCVNHWGPCDCGKVTVGLRSVFPTETTPDGWFHSAKACRPPGGGAVKCSCGFAVLRTPGGAWSTATPKDIDGPTAKVHTANSCFSPID